jgi:hypothetical protein
MSLSAAYAYTLRTPSAMPLPTHCRLPTDGQGDPVLTMEYSSCSAQAELAYQAAVGQYFAAMIPRETWLEVTVALAGLSLSVAVWLSLLGLQWPKFLRRGPRMPGALRVVLGSAALCGTVVFVLAMLLDLSNFNPRPFSPLRPADYPGIYGFAASLSDGIGLHSLVEGWTDQWTVGTSSFGLQAFAAFAVGACCVWATMLRKGALVAAESTLEFYVGPLLLVFEGGSFVLNREVMTLSVMQATAGWQAGGVPVLSNYAVLVAVAVPLSVAGLGKACMRMVSSRRPGRGAAPVG